MFFYLTIFLSSLLQNDQDGSELWWVFGMGLVVLIAFFIYLRNASEQDLAETLEFEKRYPLALAMPEGFVPPITAVEETHDDHGHGHDHGHDHDTHDTHATPEPSDLTRIEGIGPKIAELLKQNGIYTYSQLATTDPEAIKTLLAKAGPQFKLADPTTWPQQAALIANGQWAELESLQSKLKAGRHVD